MARCEECLHFEVCESLEQGNGLMKVHPIHCGCYKPAADVAPRAEVADEVFKEVLKKLFEMQKRYEQVRHRGKAEQMMVARCEIYKLQKKYTEENE